MKVRANRHTAALAALLLCMWYAGAAQQNGGAYLLAFLVGAMAVVSWLHARVNLRSLDIIAGVVPPAREGENFRVPLLLVLKDGRSPRGLEITASGVRKPVFVERIEPGQPLQIELDIPALAPGKKQSLAIAVRSLFPLGFFTASKAFEVQQGRLVLPKPSGTLPLPQPDASTTTTDSAGAAATQALGHGEDFAGVKEWQPGDSLRHVDWKAYARGRPLMVKRWAGTPAQNLWLSWNDAPMPESTRAGQLAKWVDEAEASGLRYGLRLPGKTLALGSGPAHRLQCLEALALQAASEAGNQTVAAPAKKEPLSTHETSDASTHRGLILLGMALLLVQFPFLGSVPWAGSAALFVALAVRTYQQWRRAKPWPQWPRLTLIALAVGITWRQQGTLQGLETGIAVLLAVTAGKILEARTPRDIQFLALLGWFLCLCTLTLDQSMGRSLYALAVFMLITTALISFRDRASSLANASRMAGTLFVQAVPFVVLLFFLFPRGSFDIARRLSRVLVHQSGMSSHLDPGSVAKLAKTESLAFYATIENAPVPDYSQRYWRCIVLWDCQGLSWQRGGGLSRLPRSIPSRDQEVRQRIMLEPTGQSWLPALDLPTRPLTNTDEHFIAYDDDTLRSLSVVDGMRRFRVSSHLTLQSKNLPADHRRVGLQLPAQIPERVRDLATTLAAKGRPEEIVNAALSYFRTEGFRYTIEPGTYSPQQGMEEFLLDRRLGFCEHFAASFATLMRLANIPARVVMGYLGGEHNETNNYLTIRQSDAHAWTEVWLPERGWVRIDPTAALAPARMNTDLLTFLEGTSEGAGGLARNFGLGRALQRAQLYLDHLNYLWYERVVQFDEMEQSEMFADWGIFKYRLRTLILFATGIFLLPLLGLWFWVARRVRHPNPAVREWQALCRRLAKVGVTRGASEGPLAFAHRAAKALPAAKTEIHAAAELYAQQRYGTAQLDTAALKSAFRKIRTRA